MKLDVTIPDEIVLKVIDGIMANFPEASAGSVLRCQRYNYDAREFTFRDDAANGKIYKLDQITLTGAFVLLFSNKWPAGCRRVPFFSNDTQIDDWLCECDATDFDAFVQIACLGEVIYG